MIVVVVVEVVVEVVAMGDGWWVDGWVEEGLKGEKTRGLLRGNSSTYSMGSKEGSSVGSLGGQLALVARKLAH